MTERSTAREPSVASRWTFGIRPRSIHASRRSKVAPSSPSTSTRGFRVAVFSDIPARLSGVVTDSAAIRRDHLFRTTGDSRCRSRRQGRT
jgi:hypothetical protein